MTRLPKHLATARNRPLIVGHRGAGALLPPNSLIGFRRAFEEGADLVEMDVRVSADGRLVLWDRPVLQVQGQPPLEIATSSFLQLAAVHLSVDRPDLPRQSICLLEQALELLPVGKYANIDIKTVDAITPTLHLVRERGWLANLVFTGCPEDWGQRLLALEPEASVFLNIDPELTALAESDYGMFCTLAINKVARCGLCGINFNHRLLSREIIQMCHNKGFHVWTWTVDDPSRMMELHEWGVDAITSNDPGLLSRTLAS